MMIELTIIKPDDLHNHLRQGELMPHLVRETARVFQRSNVMPNTLPPVINPEGVKKYHEELQSVGTDLEFLMTFKIMPDTDPNIIPALKEAGAVAGKYYPIGVTTHSEDSVADIDSIFPVFEAMQAEDMVLCIHGEVPWEDEIVAESAFLPTLQKIINNFPKLRIVLEHISTRDAVEFIKNSPDNVAATITIHHLFLTRSDFRDGGKLNPFNYCKPTAKRESDREALVKAALSGNPKFFLGTDSAAHLKVDKEGPKPKPGIYSAPVALPLLAEIFEEAGQLDRLENYTSKFGADFYKLPQNESKLTLVKEDWVVSQEYFGVVPFKAGETLHWKVKSE